MQTFIKTSFFFFPIKKHSLLLWGQYFRSAGPVVTLEARLWLTLTEPLASLGWECTGPLNPSTGPSRGPYFLSLWFSTHRALVGVVCWGWRAAGHPLEAGRQGVALLV